MTDILSSFLLQTPKDRGGVSYYVNKGDVQEYAPTEEERRNPALGEWSEVIVGGYFADDDIPSLVFTRNLPDKENITLIADDSSESRKLLEKYGIRGW